jgi:hypothetical protein
MVNVEEQRRIVKMVLLEAKLHDLRLEKKKKEQERKALEAGGGGIL